MIVDRSCADPVPAPPAGLTLTPTSMWAANLLTLSRLPLAAAFWLVADRPGWALAVMALAAFTDVIDGRVARAVRRRHGRPADAPSLGAWLDPLCDKTFVVSVLAATWWQVRPPLPELLAIAARELVLVPLAAVYRFTPLVRARMRYDFRAGVPGKAATVAQFVAITLLLTGHPWWVAAAWLAGAIGLVAAAHYVARGVQLARRR
jgi:phosphatidylglycerophosphate synthase